MTQKNSRLADTIRKPKVKTSSTTVKDTLQTGENKRTRRTTIYLNADMWQQLKIATIEDGTNLSQLVEQLATDYLEKRKKTLKRPSCLMTA